MSAKYPWLVLATTNPHKAEEIASILGGLSIPLKTLKDFPPLPTVEETGTTYEENAELKSRAVAAALNFPAIADDSGIEIDAMDGKPGIYSSRFMGEETPYAEKNRRILETLKDAPGGKRGARFVCAAALTLPDGETFVVRGEVSGTIPREAGGQKGFGYDPIFFLPEFGKTMAEISTEEKNRISHRALAFRKLSKILLEKLK